MKREAPLAIHGGAPVRAGMLPYGQHHIDDADIAAVVEVLKSDWITTGPRVGEFEEAFAAHVGARHAVTFSSGTAALHGAAHAAGLKPGDDAITTALTFCATANCVRYMGADVLFADIRSDTLTIDPSDVERRLTAGTRALIPVDFAGHPADLDELLAIADRRGLTVIEDACHALGATYRRRPVGSISHMSVFSFHPVKHITTGEGGAVTTNDDTLARTLRLVRNHGIDSDARNRSADGQYFYEMVELGYNYRLTDLGCALGQSQLRHAQADVDRRRAIAYEYRDRLGHLPIEFCEELPDSSSAWHIFPIRLQGPLVRQRDAVFAALRAENIGVNVHYIPVYRHPYYRELLGDLEDQYPVTEDAYAGLITIPLFPTMTDHDVADVVTAVDRVVGFFERSPDT